jgi:type I restriction enzyme M protein
MQKSLQNEWEKTGKMTTEEYQAMGETAAAQAQKKQLFGKLKAMADQLRSNMDASEFKNYVLGIIFYRYLSENLVRQFKEKTGFDYVKSVNQDEEATKKLTSDQLKIGYFIKPEHLWTTLMKRIADGKFTYLELEMATKELLASTMGKGSQKDFSNLFDDLNLESEKLGPTPMDKTALVSKIMLMVDAIEFDVGNAKIDILGDAYEFFLGDFAAASGKKGGEFYTPACMAKLVAKLALNGRTSFEKAYDPCCGSTGLLLALKNEIPENGHIGKLYGQEMNPTTYNLGRMNMLLHGVPFSDFDIFKGDTINKPQVEKTKEEEENGVSDVTLLQDKFDVIVANPPFSQDYTPTDTLLLDPRFRGPGILAPKSYEDWLFVEHMLYCLKPGGTLAVVLAPGPLFRGGAEETIRKFWIERENTLDAVVSIPGKCFYGTSISTAVCVFKKDRQNNSVLFVDASKEFIEGKKQNSLSDEQILKIADTVLGRKEIEGYSHLASLEELASKNFELNVPNYVVVKAKKTEYRQESLILSELLKSEEETSELIKNIGKVCK